MHNRKLVQNRFSSESAARSVLARKIIPLRCNKRV